MDQVTEKEYEQLMQKMKDEANSGKHPKREDCQTDECMICAFRDCPLGYAEHYWHDGCGCDKPADGDMQKMKNEATESATVAELKKMAPPSTNTAAVSPLYRRSTLLS